MKDYYTTAEDIVVSDGNGATIAAVDILKPRMSPDWAFHSPLWKRVDEPRHLRKLRHYTKYAKKARTRKKYQRRLADYRKQHSKDWIIALIGGQWHHGSGAGRFAVNLHDLNRPLFPMGGLATPDMIKTEMLLSSQTGATYPIYYCCITERYFIKLAHLFWEVEYKRVRENGREFRKWVQTGVALPVEGKERNNDEALC